MKKPKIYIASPCGFRPSESEFYEKVLAAVERSGWEPCDPWKLTDAGLLSAASALPFGPEQKALWQKINADIYRNNIAGIESSSALLAILNGMEPDSGTSFEVGYAASRGMPIEIFRDDFRSAGDNSGAEINIMLEYSCRDSGGQISRTLPELEACLASCLSEALKNS